MVTLIFNNSKFEIHLLLKFDNLPQILGIIAPSNCIYWCLPEVSYLREINVNLWSINPILTVHLITSFLFNAHDVLWWTRIMCCEGQLDSTWVPTTSNAWPQRQPTRKHYQTCYGVPNLRNRRFLFFISSQLMNVSVIKIQWMGNGRNK